MSTVTQVVRDRGSTTGRSVPRILTLNYLTYHLSQWWWNDGCHGQLPLLVRMWELPGSQVFMQPSVNELVKRNVVCICTGTLFNHQKEWNPAFPQLLPRCLVLPRKLTMLGWGPHFSQWLEPCSAACTMVFISEFTFIYSAFLHPAWQWGDLHRGWDQCIRCKWTFWLACWNWALASVNFRSLIGNVGAIGPAPASDVAPEGGLPPPPLLPCWGEESGNKEEPEESDDGMGFGVLN